MRDGRRFFLVPNHSQILCCGRLVLHVGGHKFRPHAPVDQPNHLDCPKNFSNSGIDYFTDVDVPRRFDWLAAECHMSTTASLRSEASRFVQAHRPKPFVYSYFVGRVHLEQSV